MLNILLLCDYHKNVAENMLDHIESFEKYSKHKIYRLSIYGEIPPSLNINDFDVIIIHYSLNILNIEIFSNNSYEQIKRFNGIKCLFIQDEYRNVNNTVMLINYLEIHFLFTCVNKHFQKFIYEKLDKKIQKIETLTSYVPEKLLNKELHKPKIRNRKNYIFYRSREVHYCGELGYEKKKIADYFIKNINSKIKIDIDVTEKSRIYGNKYIQKMLNSKITLGTESGSSVIDFDGNIFDNYKKLIENKFDYLDFYAKYIKEKDWLFPIAVIPPRCFESSALKTVMILFEGSYSKILKPNRHYLALKKDFSNFSYINELITDDNFLQKIADRTFNEIALNEKYSYRSFINNFDTLIQSKTIKKKKKSLIKK